MMKRQFEDVTRIVIKIGTSSLVLPTGKINLEKIDQLAFVISSLMNKGKEVILVSSGAMGFGLDILKMEKRPTNLAKQQAVSSVGQVAMMSLYSQIFAHYQTNVSQILLTRDVVVFPESLANVTNAFESLISLGIVPIVNENDAVSVDEMDHATKFGDNDRLSAVVAGITKADLLIMLSDIEKTLLFMRMRSYAVMLQSLRKKSLRQQVVRAVNLAQVGCLAKFSLLRWYLKTKDRWS